MVCWSVYTLAIIIAGKYGSRAIDSSLAPNGIVQPLVAVMAPRKLELSAPSDVR